MDYKRCDLCSRSALMCKAEGEVSGHNSQETLRQGSGRCEGRTRFQYIRYLSLSAGVEQAIVGRHSDWYGSLRDTVQPCGGHRSYRVLILLQEGCPCTMNDGIALFCGVRVGMAELQALEPFSGINFLETNFCLGRPRVV